MEITTMKTEELYQVNYKEVKGEGMYTVTLWSADGYHGRTIDSDYLDGCDYTDWCIKCGSKSECHKYASEKNLEIAIIKEI